MPKLTIISRDGRQRAVDVKPGLSVMEVIRNSGDDELLALCGGCCSCATCHVYVEGDSSMLPPMSSDEFELLDSSDHRAENSRLSCQIPFGETLDGLTVRIAPED